jgi:hypothetical protein
VKLAPVALALVLVVVGSFMVVRLGAPPSEVELAGYATTLVGRTPGQRHNARLAARALDGVIIAPGAAFSFNRTVRSWTMDRGISSTCRIPNPWALAAGSARSRHCTMPPCWPA